MVNMNHECGLDEKKRLQEMDGIEGVEKNQSLLRVDREVCVFFNPVLIMRIQPRTVVFFHTSDGELPSKLETTSTGFRM